MSDAGMALYRGRISVRPWRVGVLVDVEDASEVRRALTLLCGVWGGLFMPILDVRASTDELRTAYRLFDLDSLYAEEPPEGLSDLLEKGRYGWGGKGRYGPFGGGNEGVHMGLLRSNALFAQSDDSPWKGPATPELLVDAYLGVNSEGVGQTHTRPALATSELLRFPPHYSRPSPTGFVVVREDSVSDVVSFWNYRSLAGATYPLTASGSEFNEAVLADGVDVAALRPPSPSRTADERVHSVDVWGWDDLNHAEQHRLAAWMAENHFQPVGRARDLGTVGSWFPGFEAVASTQFRVETRPSERLVPLTIPRLPLSEPVDVLPGLVAAEIDFDQVSGLDPRLTVSIPPHGRHGALIDRRGYGAERARISTIGPVFGVQATLGELDVPNVYNLEVLRVLFDDEAAVVGQSDEGKFQTRAAEIFGGPTAGYLAQPGVREAILVAARRTTGVTLQELQRRILDNRGDWPDPLHAFHQSPWDYAIAQTNSLLYSGLLVPLLEIQCPECRITLRLSAEQLAASLPCEFCGGEVRLALALALTKAEWRYRLAGHLTSNHVEAFLPAMAASAVLSALNASQGPPASHIFGLEVQLPGKRKIEVDVATIMKNGWMVVLGEVKNHKPIDENDVTNLFSLQSALIEKGVPCIPLFATFNDSFSDAEKMLIREAVDQTPRSVEIYGRRFPLAPLLLTRRDMSRPYFNDEHPWRWSTAGSGTGVLGVALESCKRNLGLESFSWAEQAERTQPSYHWESLPPGEAS